MRQSWKRGAAAVLALSCAFATGGAVARAVTAPSSAGPIDGCYDSRRGTLRLVVDAGGDCDQKETAISFLGSLATAADADKLDGLDSTAFARADATAADADLLDGLDSTAFQMAGATAADADLLDGLDSTAFYRAGSTVDNALALGGHAASAFLGSTVYQVGRSVAGGQPNASLTQTVSCVAGDRALSGGYSEVDRGTHVETSMPGANGWSWTVKWWNDDTTDSVNVWVSCAQKKG